MKKCILFVIPALLFNFTLWSQTWNSSWEKKFENFSSSGFSDVIADKNGGYTFLGKVIMKSNDLPCIWLVRTDEKGDTLWSRIYSASTAIFSQKVLQVADNGYLVIGSEAVETQIPKLFLLKADSNGKELWRKNFYSGEIVSGEDIIALENGSFVLVGFKRMTGDLQNLWLTNISPEGDIIWEKTYGGTNQATGRSVKLLPDGGYAVAGKIMKSGAKDSDAWILRTNNNGDTLWTSRIRTPGMVVWPECICCTPDSFLMVVGWQGTSLNDINSENPVFDYDLVLYKLDRKGKVVVKKNVDSEGSEGGNSIVARADGKFILAGKKETSFSGRVGSWLLLIDRDGKILSENLIKFHFINDQASKIINTSDGGFLVVGPGDIASENRSYAWAVKFDPF